MRNACTTSGRLSNGVSLALQRNQRIKSHNKKADKICLVISHFSTSMFFVQPRPKHSHLSMLAQCNNFCYNQEYCCHFCDSCRTGSLLSRKLLFKRVLLVRDIGALELGVMTELSGNSNPLDVLTPEFPNATPPSTSALNNPTIPPGTCYASEDCELEKYCYFASSTAFKGECLDRQAAGTSCTDGNQCVRHD